MRPMPSAILIALILPLSLIGNAPSIVPCARAGEVKYKERRQQQPQTQEIQAKSKRPPDNPARDRPPDKRHPPKEPPVSRPPDTRPPQPPPQPRPDPQPDPRDWDSDEPILWTSGIGSLDHNTMVVVYPSNAVLVVTSDRFYGDVPWSERVANALEPFLIRTEQPPPRWRLDTTLRTTGN